MKAYTIKRAALCVALGACLGAMLPSIALAQNVSGAVAGRATAGDQVTVVSSSTGLTRTVTVGADGSYRLGQLPVGDYQLQLSREGQALGDQVAVSVAVGGTTTVNLASGGGVTNLDALQVRGTRVINRVDVYSTETSFNINRQEISRLPVAQDLSAVALMAPGVVGAIRRLVACRSPAPRWPRTLSSSTASMSPTCTPGAASVPRHSPSSTSSRSRPVATRSSSAAPPAA